MIDWRQSRVVAGTILALFFVVQLAIPISRLGDERGQRFGWQMYSREVRAIPEFGVITGDGEVAIDILDYLPTSRIEVDVAMYLPAHLCDVIPEAVSVSWEGGSHRC